LTLALVDDEPMWRRVLIRMLESRELRILEIGRGRDLLAHIAEPDLVCLDLHLDDGPGLDWMVRFHRERPGVPFVVTTADTKIDTAVKAMRMGAFDYVTKPFDQKRFVQAIDGALEKARNPGALPPRSIRSPEEAATPPHGVTSLEALEREAIQRALRQTEGHVGKAAKMLGMGRATLYRRLTAYQGPKSA
jgi:two-component system response regulator HydG